MSSSVETLNNDVIQRLLFPAKVKSTPLYTLLDLAVLTHEPLMVPMLARSAMHNTSLLQALEEAILAFPASDHPDRLAGLINAKVFALYDDTYIMSQGFRNYLEQESVRKDEAEVFAEINHRSLCELTIKETIDSFAAISRLALHGFPLTKQAFEGKGCNEEWHPIAGQELSDSVGPLFELIREVPGRYTDVQVRAQANADDFGNLFPEYVCGTQHTTGNVAAETASAVADAAGNTLARVYMVSKDTAKIAALLRTASRTEEFGANGGNPARGQKNSLCADWLFNIYGVPQEHHNQLTVFERQMTSIQGIMQSYNANPRVGGLMAAGEEFDRTLTDFGAAHPTWDGFDRLRGETSLEDFNAEIAPSIARLKQYDLDTVPKPIQSPILQFPDDYQSWMESFCKDTKNKVMTVTVHNTMSSFSDEYFRDLFWKMLKADRQQLVQGNLGTLFSDAVDSTADGATVTAATTAVISMLEHMQ